MRRKKNYIVCTLLLVIAVLASNLVYSAEFVFSSHPFANPATIHNRFDPLISYLSKKTGIKVSLQIAPSYLSHIKALGLGKADFGFAGPSPYVRMKDKYGGIELLARFKVENDKNDKVVFICKKNSPYKDLLDLKGKSFAFGDHQSFGSHFMPRWILNQKGLSLNDLAAYDFVKSHDNVVLSVLHGDFAAGGVRQDVYEKYSDRSLRILAGPFDIPPHVLVCRSSLPKALKDQLRESLLGLSSRAVLDQISHRVTGFEPVADKEFDPARKIIKFIESR